MQFPPISRHIIPLWSKYSPQNNERIHFLNHYVVLCFHIFLFKILKLSSLSQDKILAKEH
jgi:hypothetical protein